MLSSLRARQPRRDDDNTGFVDTKSGVFIYNGHPAHFHEWEFRTMLKWGTSNKQAQKELVSKVVEGLRDPAFAVVKDLSLETLTESDEAMALIIDKVRRSVFPYNHVEAQHLYTMGNKEDGILTRQPGEAMFAYITRRRRWYDTLQNLDPETTISANIRAELLLKNARLNTTESLMIKTSVNNVVDFEKYAEALIRQHAKIHLNEKGGLWKGGDKEQRGRNPFRSKGSG